MTTAALSLNPVRQPALMRLISGSRVSKVFAIGFNKTGTTSLHRIFTDLGYRSYHGTKWRDTSRHMIFRLYDAFCDGVPDDFRRLDSRFAGARFILQVRDLDTWLDSRVEHIRRLPEGRDRHPEWTADVASVTRWVRRWQDHHLAVLQHFRNRPGDLLVVNYIRDPDAAARISTFLGHPGPIEKPHANANPAAAKQLKNHDMIAAALVSLGIPEGEWKNDLLCPALGGAENLPSDSSAAHPPA